MKKVLCAVFDEKADFYLPPFAVNTTAEAERAFALAITNGDAPFSQFPGDVTLYSIGSYDDNSAEIVPFVPAQLICKGSSIKVRSDAS